MILSDHDLYSAFKHGQKLVDPIVDGAIQPSSIDVCLGSELLLSVDDSWDHTYSVPQEWEHYTLVEDDPFTLMPGDFVLGSTMELVSVPNNMCCFVYGRSTTGRRGLIVETAGLVDPGFVGEVTLEIFNLSRRPIYLTPGMGIAQLVFQRLTSTCVRPYGTDGLGSRYQGQRGPTAPRLP